MCVQKKTMTGHVDKTYQAQNPDMARYLAAVQAMEKHFLGITVQTIPRADNKAAYELAKQLAPCKAPRLMYSTKY